MTLISARSAVYVLSFFALILASILLVDGKNVSYGRETFHQERPSFTWLVMTESESRLINEPELSDCKKSSSPVGSDMTICLPLVDGSSVLIGVAESSLSDFSFRSAGASSFNDGIIESSCLRNLPSCWSKKISSISSFCGQWTQEYLIFLDQYPVITKSITAGIVGGVGDILAQLGEMAILGQDCGQLDFHRAFTIAAEGLLVSGPLLHFAYEWLETHFSALDDSAVSHSALYVFLMTITQVLIDLVVMDSIFVATLMVTSAILQGRRHQVLHELRTEYIPAVKVSWLSSLSMAPIQFINFGYIPIQFRVIVTNLQDVVWNAAVSFMAHRSRN